MSTNSESLAEYTPSTEEVREEYWLASGDPSRDSKAKREFDRWLADHERAVAATAWDEGRMATRDDYGTRRYTKNPYREPGQNALVTDERTE